MKLVLTGATGFTGSQVLKQALADASVTELVVLSRRPTGVQHPKLKEVVVADFTDYSALAKDMKADACIWALGISQTEVSREDYVKITFDYTVAALNALLKQNANVRFCFLSGQGANQDESKARAYFGKIKGRTEKKLAELSPNVFIFRPGFIKPVAAHPSQKTLVKVATPIFNFLARFIPLPSVNVDQLAATMLKTAKDGASVHLFENQDI